MSSIKIKFNWETDAVISACTNKETLIDWYIIRREAQSRSYWQLKHEVKAGLAVLSDEQLKMYMLQQPLLTELITEMLVERSGNVQLGLAD